VENCGKLSSAFSPEIIHSIYWCQFDVLILYLTGVLLKGGKGVVFKYVWLKILIRRPAFFTHLPLRCHSFKVEVVSTASINYVENLTSFGPYLAGFPRSITVSDGMVEKYHGR
jgi:hypothetical protein